MASAERPKSVRIPHPPRKDSVPHGPRLQCLDRSHRHGREFAYALAVGWRQRASTPRAVAIESFIGRVAGDRRVDAGQGAGQGAGIENTTTSAPAGGLFVSRIPGDRAAIEDEGCRRFRVTDRVPDSASVACSVPPDDAVGYRQVTNIPDTPAVPPPTGSKSPPVTVRPVSDAVKSDSITPWPVPLPCRIVCCGPAPSRLLRS